MNTRIWALIVVIALTVTAGCSYVPQAEEVAVSMYSDGADGGVGVSPVRVVDSGVRVDGYLTVGGGEPEQDTYRDVSVRLYRSDGELGCVESVGDWEVRSTKDVSFSVEWIPAYVVIYAPDFWEGPMVVQYFVFDSEEEEFAPKEASAETELPVTVSGKTEPRCGGA